MERFGVVVMFILGFLSVGMIIACVSANDWAMTSYNDQSFPVRIGLWKRCIGESGNSDCVVMGDNVPSWLQVVRALAVLTCLFSIIGTALTLLLLRAKNLASRYVTWFFLCAGWCVIHLKSTFLTYTYIYIG